MGRNQEGKNRFKKSEEYEGDTAREVEDDDNKSFNEDGGKEYPKEYKKKSDKVKYAEDTEGERFKVPDDSNYSGSYLPYGGREDIYDKVTDGDPDEHGKNYYLPRVQLRPKLSTLAKGRNK